MSDLLRHIVHRNRAGEAASIVSVCSAQPDVLTASLALARELDQPIVIEATSNQVNQQGGYTGLTPDLFAQQVYQMADAEALDRNALVLGGDHLGPQAWRDKPAEQAMDLARIMVRDYVQAGFGKIHLDCSEGCAGEGGQLSDEITAERSADLAAICEEAADGRALSYVIGTEVPPPGGARSVAHEDIPATTPDAARATLAAHKSAFEARGIGVEKIAGLVLQPGVEFAPMHVHHLPMDREPGLLEAIQDWPNLCLEAHSTDYQHPAAYQRLAELGFAFQKVGPALTFAYRQALYALDIALRMMGKPGGLPEKMEKIMIDHPGYWQGHYHNTDDVDVGVSRHFGLSDRIRYYWPHPDAQSAVSNLMQKLTDTMLPDPVLWQIFGADVLNRADTLTGTQAERLIRAQIQTALRPYFLTQSQGSVS